MDSKMKCLSAFTDNFPKEIVPSGFKVVIADKRNIILIYAHNQIRSLLFDDIAASVSGNTPCQKFYDHEIAGEAGIRTIANSSRNTFGLLEDGRIFYFKSFRAIEVIPSLKNVRAICESPYGVAMIRNSSPEEIFIEFYADHGMLKKYKKIAIGWDEKWSFERDQEKSVLQLVRLDCDRLQQLFFHFIDVEAAEKEDLEKKNHGGYSKAVVFSINCSLFCTFYENAKDVQTGVNSIRTFLSDVQDIRVFPTPGVMCVLLTSGVIHLLYADHEGDLRDDSVFLGMEEIDTVESIAEDNCVYLSDRTRCVKVTLTMTDQELQWTVDKIAIFGVVGISYLPTIRSVLLLTENNFIYAIDHDMKGSDRTTSHVEECLAVLQGDLAALTTTSVEMQAETCKSTAINVLLNPQVISDNCKVVLSFKSYVDFDELPSLRDQVEDQMYDITLEFQFEPELEKIFTSEWRLEVLLRGGGGQCHKEAIRLDDRFLKRPKVRLFRNVSRNSEQLGSDFEVAIQGFIDSAEKLLIDVPLKVAYNLESLLEVLEEDPFEMNGKWSFKIHTDNRTILNSLLDMIIEQRMSQEPFVIGIGQRAAIVVTPDKVSCTFKSDDQSALQLLKKILLLEAHGRGIWTTISYEPMETIALCELSARHSLFGEDTTQATLQEVYKDIRDCVIKLS